MKTKEKLKYLEMAERAQELDNYADAYKYYHILGDEGVTEALFEYGRNLKFGWEGKQDAAKAFRIFQKGAVRGVSMCQWMLADCYKKGIGVEKNEKKAFFWIKEAAETNNPFAIDELSTYYHNGIGTEKDLTKAVEYLTLAADQNIANAQYRLGILYYTGDGVKQDQGYTELLMRKARDGGMKEAQEFLDKYYKK
jgi:TPR repeat protein